MVQIKLLDKGPFYYHDYEIGLKYKKDEFGYWTRELPDSSWLLPYQPAYITTNEEWLVERLKAYARDAFEQVDIIQDDEIFSCSIPQDMIDICVPPKDRFVENELPRIPYTKRTVASDGYKVS